MMKTQLPSKGQEPSMYLQRPSTGKSQDVRHILTRTFRELYTRDTVRPETVKHLQVSKGGDDPYHERYVESLQKVYDEWQKRMDESAMLERHIMQAQARATSADERELNQTLTSCDNYSELGLPPGRSNFRSCIDTELLRSYGLITPEDYSLAQPDLHPAPELSKVPSYARQTVTSEKRSRKNEQDDSPLFILPQVRSMGDMMSSSFISAEYDTESLNEVLELESYMDTDNWKLNMSTEQREKDRQDLANMNAKINFLRNPRHIPPSAPPGCRTLIKQFKKKPKEICIQEKIEDLKPVSPSLIFMASPPVVSFTEYKVGQVYEIVLELKNVSTVLRQCRVLPPKSSYFSVGLGQFPGEHGLVAPGMSCKYAIRFIPDSLKDFRDEVVVQTQSSKPMIIPVEGRRAPPCLTVPPVWDIGYCLVSGFHVRQFVIKNEGGSGRFCLMPKSSWPAVNFKSAVSKPSVTIGPFEVRPSTLELLKGQTGVIEVVFHPTSAGVFEEELTMVCDNCNVQHYKLTGEGQMASVSLEYVENGVKEPLPGELCDKSAQHLIQFEELNPYTYIERTIKVKNQTNVELPFEWKFYKPQFNTERSAEDKELGIVEARAVDTNPSFSIIPPAGTLQRLEVSEYQLTFSPSSIGDYHDVLHMMLNHLPPGSASSVSHDETTQPEDDKVSVTSSQKDAVLFKDVTALEVEVKGKCVPLNIVLHPYAIYIPGKLLVGTSIKKIFSMANHSYSTITFQFEPHTDKHIIEVEPPYGELDPGMAIDLELSITGEEPGKLDHTLFCHIHNMENPLPLQILTEFKGPEINIEEPNVNFGLIRLGETSVREITLNNLSQLPTKWSISDFVTAPASENSMESNEVMFNPSSGELKPLERRTISIKFTPSKVATVHRVFEVSAEDGNKCSIAGHAEVQSPAVCLMECELSPKDIYVGVPVLCKAVLHNQTFMTTHFEWGKPEGRSSETCSIEIDQITGRLAPKEEKTITVSFVSSQVGLVDDLRIPCKVEGMDQPLCLSLTCDVLGLSVVCRTSDCKQNMSEELEVDFGEEVELGANPRRYLYICNETAIPASYSINVTNFPVTPPTPPEKRLDTTGTSIRKALLGRTPNLTDSVSAARAQSDLAKAVLSSGLGAGFSVSPANGNLSPYGEEVIEITAYSNIWGTYTDNITCKVGDMEAIMIPVSMTVIGCPLNFQMTAAIPDQKPIVRFGTHVSGVRSVKRNMRINNTSPFDIRLDWRVFNQIKGDDQLLDFTVCYGRCFPIRDQDGNEIINSDEEMPALERAATELIPNSPDTTPAVSRQVTRITEVLEKVPEKDELAEVSEELPAKEVSDSAPENENQTDGPESPGEEIVLKDDKNEEVKETEENPKIISVFLNAHEGQMSQQPYKITPEQLVVPANGHAQVFAVFTPLPANQVTDVMDCHGYALGYMSLDGKAAGIPGQVCRKEAYEASTLRLDMTAQLKPALLTIENNEDEGMRYRAVMSDLVKDGQAQKESIKVCSTILSNRTETPLTFRLLVNKPFILVDLDPTSNIEGSTRATETLYNTLNPQHSLIVKVGFQTTCELLTEDAISDMEALGSESDRKLDIQDNLIVEFNNMAEQKVPLHATLSVPQIYLSKQSLDFGTCLVNQCRVMELMISNHTSSHSFWKVSIESKSETCLSDTFAVEPSEGILDAYITHVSNSKSLLQVKFTAKHAEHYEFVFLFTGILGETPQRLYVRGEGSYDGKHESILNP
ncbi:hypothetical protein SNE40_022422 [Patella caerulea]|uniref:Deleted in lung and esophageal cancer protein 1 n=1 Tax=Patella caerulea TaxID=87958 RepID=A0AAN8G3Z2_PATCE